MGKLNAEAGPRPTNEISHEDLTSQGQAITHDWYVFSEL